MMFYQSIVQRVISHIGITIMTLTIKYWLVKPSLLYIGGKYFVIVLSKLFSQLPSLVVNDIRAEWRRYILYLPIVESLNPSIIITKRGATVPHWAGGVTRIRESSESSVRQKCWSPLFTRWCWFYIVSKVAKHLLYQYLPSTSQPKLRPLGTT